MISSSSPDPLEPLGLLQPFVHGALHAPDACGQVHRFSEVTPWLDEVTDPQAAVEIFADDITNDVASARPPASDRKHCGAASLVHVITPVAHFHRTPFTHPAGSTQDRPAQTAIYRRFMQQVRAVARRVDPAEEVTVVPFDFIELRHNQFFTHNAKRGPERRFCH